MATHKWDSRGMRPTIARENSDGLEKSFFQHNIAIIIGEKFIP